MKTKTIDYFDGKQKLIGELFYHDQKEPQAAIIVFHAFEGRGSFTVDYAKKLAAKGFAVFVADMYGDAKVATTIEDCFQLITPFLQDRELVRRRADPKTGSFDPEKEKEMGREFNPIIADRSFCYVLDFFQEHLST